MRRRLCIWVLVALAIGCAASVSATGVLLNDVPAYIWHNGCGPTAVGMVVGYYATHGYGDLVDGNAAHQVKASDYLNFHVSDYDDPVNQMISSLENYNEYCVPRDDTGSVLPDRSTMDPSHAHANNCLADFMFTSRSAHNLNYGSTYIQDIPNAFAEYVSYASGGAYSGSARAYYDTSFQWDYYEGQIRLDHPALLEVDSDGNGTPDHFVTAVGYEQNGGLGSYAFYNTWDRSIHWASCHPVMAGQPWGVAAGVYFDMTAVPEPSSVLIMIMSCGFGALVVLRRRARVTA